MNKRLLLMSSVAVVLGGYVLLGEGGLLAALWRPSAPVGEVAPQQGGVANSGTPREGVKLNPLQGLEAQAFPAIVDQPLFNPGRAPRPAEPPPPAPEPAPVAEPEPAPQETGPVASDYKLLAVSTGPAGQVAALRLNQSSEVVFVRAGQDVQQWKVISVGPRSIVIGTPEQNVEISMFDNANAPAGDTNQSSDVPDGEDGQNPNITMPNAEASDPQPEGGN